MSRSLPARLALPVAALAAAVLPVWTGGAGRAAMATLGAAIAGGEAGTWARAAFARGLERGLEPPAATWRAVLDARGDGDEASGLPIDEEAWGWIARARRSRPALEALLAAVDFSDGSREAGLVMQRLLRHPAADLPLYRGLARRMVEAGWNPMHHHVANALLEHDPLRTDPSVRAILKEASPWALCFLLGDGPVEERRELLRVLAERRPLLAASMVNSDDLDTSWVEPGDLRTVLADDDPLVRQHGLTALGRVPDGRGEAPPEDQQRPESSTSS